MFTIRIERQTDNEAIREVITEAFKQPDEAALVDRIRQAGLTDISLVAEQDGEAVGHILFSPVAIEGTPLLATGLAPLAVMPDAQGKGIGRQLVWAGIERCRKRGIQAIFVLGDPAYYSRFGFRAAATLGITSNYDSPEHPGAFQVLELTDGVLRGIQGRAVYDFEKLPPPSA